MLNLSLRAPKALFSTTRIERRQGEVRVPDVETRRVEWVVSRALCLYRRFDLAAVPARKRKAALAFELRRWAPFAQFAQYIVWQGAVAQVWVWDDVQHGLASETAAGRNGGALPESLLRGEPGDEGLQLIRCWDGLEARFWQQGGLRACSFWPQLPESRTWSLFVRSLGLPSDTPLPDVEEAELRRLPWKGQRVSMPWRIEAIERVSVHVTVLLLLAALGWQLAAGAHQYQQLRAVREQVAVLNREIGPVLEAKNQALAASIRADELAPFVTGLDNLTELKRFLMPLQPFGVSLREWHYNAGQFKAVLNTDLPPLQLVQALQSDPAFVDLAPEPGTRPGAVALTWKVREEAP